MSKINAMSYVELKKNSPQKQASIYNVQLSSFIGTSRIITCIIIFVCAPWLCAGLSAMFYQATKYW